MVGAGSGDPEGEVDDVRSLSGEVVGGHHFGGESFFGDECP
jgi:hypothetical protein